jgi:hypothetical protein
MPVVSSRIGSIVSSIDRIKNGIQWIGLVLVFFKTGSIVFSIDRIKNGIQWIGLVLVFFRIGQSFFRYRITDF